MFSLYFLSQSRFCSYMEDKMKEMQVEQDALESLKAFVG